MFVECFKNNGIPYLRLVDGIRVVKDDGKVTIRKKIIKSIGPLSRYDDGQPNYVKRLKDSFACGNPIIPGLQEFCEAKPLKEYNLKFTESSPECIGHPKLFSQVLIERLLEQLGVIEFYRQTKSRTKIEFDLVGFVRALIYGRILDPSSKIGTINNLDKYYSPILDNPYKYNVYDTLTFTHEYRQNIIKKINNALITNFKRTTNMVYYDVTNFFFETDRADEDEEIDGEIVKGIRKYGVSKEERKLPIVQMGLFMDDQGIPISIETFPGNTLDHLTVIDSLKNTVDNLNLSRFIFVGDRGMCSYKNICHLIDHNKGYVVSRSIEKSTTEEKAWIMDDSDYINESSEFKYKSRVVSKVVKDEFNQKRTIVEKVVVYWSKAFADRQKQQQKKFIDLLNKFLDKPENFRLSTTQYNSLKPFFKKELEVKRTGKVYNYNELKSIIDTDKISNYIAHLGYYQIITSETKKSDKEIIDIYHGLSRIEDQFKIMKGDLNTRPLYVRTKEHIDAHLLLCMISLIVVRLIQNKIVDYQNEHNIKNKKECYWKMGLTGERIKDALNKFTVDKLPDEYYRFNYLDDPDLKLILDAFGIKIDANLYKLNELKHIKQTIIL